MVALTRLNGAIKIILNVIFVKIVANHLFGKSKLIHFPDKKFGLKNGSSIEEHYRIYQMKAANRLIRSEGYFNIF